MSITANIGTCILDRPDADKADDIACFAKVLIRLFSPLDPREEGLALSVGEIALSFYQCLKDNTIETVLEARRAHPRPHRCR